RICSTRTPSKETSNSTTSPLAGAPAASPSRPRSQSSPTAGKHTIAAVHDVVLPTLAGCGFLLRRALLGAGRPAVVDLWIGLAALLAYLELWSLVTGVGALAWVGPAAAAAAGAALVPRARPRSQRRLRDKPALSR